MMRTTHAALVLSPKFTNAAYAANAALELSLKLTEVIKMCMTPVMCRCGMTSPTLMAKFDRLLLLLLLHRAVAVGR